LRKLLGKLGITDRQSILLIIKQFTKFGLVGISNTLISLGTYYALLALGVFYILANIIAFFVSVCNAYFWNSRYVFRKAGDSDEKAKSGEAKPFMKTVTAYGFSFLLSTALLFLMVDIIGISEWIAPLITFCITIPTNFLLIKNWALK